MASRLVQHAGHSTNCVAAMKRLFFDCAIWIVRRLMVVMVVPIRDRLETDSRPSAVQCNRRTLNQTPEQIKRHESNKIKRCEIFAVRPDHKSNAVPIDGDERRRLQPKQPNYRKTLDKKFES